MTMELQRSWHQASCPHASEAFALSGKLAKFSEMHRHKTRPKLRPDISKRCITFCDDIKHNAISYSFTVDLPKIGGEKKSC